MTIAKSDQSVEMRKVAVRFLGESKDPEALKFLEELLK
jgi:HEAT repeat protein